MCIYNVSSHLCEHFSDAVRSDCSIRSFFKDAPPPDCTEAQPKINIVRMHPSPLCAKCVAHEKSELREDTINLLSKLAHRLALYEQAVAGGFDSPVLERWIGRLKSLDEGVRTTVSTLIDEELDLGFRSVKKSSKTGELVRPVQALKNWPPQVLPIVCGMEAEAKRPFEDLLLGMLEASNPTLFIQNMMSCPDAMEGVEHTSVVEISAAVIREQATVSDAVAMVWERQFDALIGQDEMDVDRPLQLDWIPKKCYQPSTKPRKPKWHQYSDEQYPRPGHSGNRNPRSRGQAWNWQSREYHNDQSQQPWQPRKHPKLQHPGKWNRHHQRR